MDIQELVDARIREIGDMPSLSITPDPAAYDDGGLPQQDTNAGIALLGETMDSTLSEISNRILEITEQVSVDYARLEKDLLKSRLEILRTAEVVLDMALTLKKQARTMLSSDLAHAPAAADPPLIPARQSRERSGRASLYNAGVADLFRRT